MVWALFHIVKRVWYEEQVREDKKKGLSRPEPPDEPVPGQGWYADPVTLPIQLEPMSVPDDAGTSVKIDRNETKLSYSFRPRPFLIVSNEYLLDQKRAWVCPLSRSVRPRRSRSLPEWVIEIPELDTSCLAPKLHSVSTEFFDDIAKRELLRSMWSEKNPCDMLSDISMKLVRKAIECHLDGVYAPRNDRLPPGSIVRYADGSERLVLANTYLGDLYHSGNTLTTTCRLSRSLHPEMAELKALPGIVPLSDSTSSTGKAAKTSALPTGFLDLGHMGSEVQSRLVNQRVGQDLSILSVARTAFRNLLMGEAEEKS